MPAVTVNRLLPVATSLPVVTVTLLAPKAAVGVIVKVAVRWVASVTTMALAVTPGLLNVTAGVPDVKCVNWPVMTTPVGAVPWAPLAGFSERTTGVPAVTVNRLLPVATSLPVVTVTLLVPVAAVVLIVSVAVNCVALVTVTALAVTPVLLNDTVEVPATKCVNWPVICTPVNTWPCFPLVGLITLTAGGLIVYAAGTTALSLNPDL